ncbi:MAG: DUF3048 domain-containing protein [Anaerolineae bacterium]
MNGLNEAGRVEVLRKFALIAVLVTVCTLAVRSIGSSVGAPPGTRIGPDDYPPGVNPLTGLAVADASVLARRPIDVKISNAPPLVRPQAGIGAADIVFEHYAEGGLTRFSAVFYGQTPERVGSIRSARLIDYEVVPMYQGMLAYSGASTGVGEKIAGSDFADRVFEGIRFGYPYYWRDESIDAPHNMFTNLAALWELASEDGINTPPDLRGMAFDAAVSPDSAGAATHIDVRYRATRAEWLYDPRKGEYLRFSDGLPHYDANTDQQVTADNVVILYARHTLTDIVESEWQGVKSYSIEIELWFEGDAVLCRDGQHYDVRWSRPTRESLISLYTRDGEPMPFKPGNTWFQVFPLPEQQESDESATVE